MKNPSDVPLLSSPAEGEAPPHTTPVLRGREGRGTTLRGLIAVGLIFAAGCALSSDNQLNAAAPGDPIIGAKISRSYTARNHHLHVPLSFDVQRWEQGGDFYNPAQPDRLTIPLAGCYFVEAQITVLGSNYNASGQWGSGNPPSPDWIIEIKRNGNPQAYVAASRLTNENPGVAQLNSAQTVECFAAGDYIQVFVTGNREIESNWPGTGGSISPVLLVTYLGSLTP